jgi:two-component system, OmpR family, KDP operon response regulator KdpE
MAAFWRFCSTAQERSSTYQLLVAVWGQGREHSKNYLRMYFFQLRAKLERDPSRPQHLITEAGMGYRYLP